MRKVLSVMVAVMMLTACLTGCNDTSKGIKASPTIDDNVRADEESLSPTQQGILVEDANEAAKDVEDAAWEGLLNYSGNTPANELAYCTSAPVSVESFENSDNPVEKKVYETLKNKHPSNLGYVYIDIDVNSKDGGFVQWSRKENSSIIGQRPNGPENFEQSRQITFGVYRESYIQRGDNNET